MGLLRDIADFIFPRQCVMCGKRLAGSERCICAHCLMQLPRTDYHLVEHSSLEKYFWQQFPIERAVAFFHHSERRARSILYEMKYKGHPQVGMEMARIYAEELKEVNFFEDIDCIVPVPLNWRRRLKRRYNQSDYLAEGLRRSTGVPIYNNVVVRVVNNPSQTTVDHTERKGNVDGIFRLKDAERIRGKHVLLVDDVTTTGSTIISCAKELAKAGDVRISVLTLAVASRTAVPTSDNDVPDGKVFGMLPEDKKDA